MSMAFGCLSFDVFIIFWEQCEESFFICQPQDNLFLFTLLYLGRPTNHNNKTPFNQNFEPKM
jgi:hypothetical protein